MNAAARLINSENRLFASAALILPIRISIELVNRPNLIDSIQNMGKTQRSGRPIAQLLSLLNDETAPANALPRRGLRLDELACMPGAWVYIYTRRQTLGMEESGMQTLKLLFEKQRYNYLALGNEVP